MESGNVLINPQFNAASFIKNQIEKLKETLKGEKVLIAVSGGVDSTTCAALTRKAVGEKLTCILIDTGFMRLGEPEHIREVLSKPPLNLPVTIINAGERFMNRLTGLSDAEEKRKSFREEFYKVLSEEARSRGCRYLVQGTIAPDWIETKGGIKTQHNVLVQVGVKTEEKYGFTLVEPLANLYKDQVRLVARSLGVPKEISERQPFPGPGLTVRCVGNVEPEKLHELKKATSIVEKELSKFKFQQYFAAILDGEFSEDEESLKAASIAKNTLGLNKAYAKVFKNLATGVKGDERVYGKVLGVKLNDGSVEFKDLMNLQSRLISEVKRLSRVLYFILGKRGGRYVIAVRAVTTRDYMTANVAEVSFKTLRTIGEKILRSCPKVSEVYYDVTPKPPATIEYE